MPKIMFTHLATMAKKGKGKTGADDPEPDGDDVPVKKKSFNKSAPGPDVSDGGEGAQDHTRQMKRRLTKATGKADPAEPDADDSTPETTGSEGGVEKSTQVAQGSDKGKTSKPKAKVGPNAMPRGHKNFGRPGSQGLRF